MVVKLQRSCMSLTLVLLPTPLHKQGRLDPQVISLGREPSHSAELAAYDHTPPFIDMMEQRGSSAAWCVGFRTFPR